MDKLLFTGGTVVVADGSFAADILVEDEKISAVGTYLSADGAETVDASGKLVMPGFIDAHTHMAMPFGGTVTADDWATGTAAAAAGGTTMLIDFALQEEGGTLAGAVEAWSEKAKDKALIDYGFPVADHGSERRHIDELPSLAERRASVKIFMAYKGTPLYTEDDDLFESCNCRKRRAFLVMVHAENVDVYRQASGAGVATTRPAFPRPNPPAGGRGRARAGDTARAVARGAILVVHVSCAPALRRSTATSGCQTVYAETCPQYFAFSYDDLAREGFEGAKYVCSPPLRDASNRGPLWNGLKIGDLQIFGSDHCSFNYREQKELGRDDFTLIPNGLPGAEERAMALWTLGVREGQISENQFVAALSTNQARIYGAYPRKGALDPGCGRGHRVVGPGALDHGYGRKPPRQRRLHPVRGG
jgi:dihydropyrimidinase